MATAEQPSGIIGTRGSIAIISTRGTTDVIHPVPFLRVLKKF